MPTTEITLEQNLFLQLKELAASLQVSPNEVVTLALEELIKRKQGEEITQQLNEASPEVHDVEALEEEQAWRRFAQGSIRRLAEKDPW